MMWTSWLMASAVAHTGPEPLGRRIEVQVPAPTAAVYDHEDRICLSMQPTLQTPDTEFDEGDYGALCESDAQETRACLIVRPGAVWPERFPDLVCDGDGHRLEVRFVAGYDPYEDLSDGVRIVRMKGPDEITMTHFATFAAPGWPDAFGILHGGECRVHDGRLLLTFKQSDDESRLTCTLIEAQEDGSVVEREVPIRLVNRLKTAD